MKLWAVRQRNGDVMLTALRPARCSVRGAAASDWYAQHGEPIGVRHLCAGGFKALTGIDASELDGPVRVELSGGRAEA